MNNLVSVIIPVYNVRPYVAEALDSVIFQTYENLEIIVIDDGSSDGSGAICDEYARRDRRIQVVHQKNKGLSTARNVGLNQMTGDIVAFLDPDDAYDHRMIEIMLKEMNKQKADIVICGFSTHKTKGRMKPKTAKRINKKSRVLSKSDMQMEILNAHFESAPWNKIYKKAIWRDLRFPDGYVYEGTYIVFDIFEKAERTVIINESLIMYRNRPGSISNTCSVKNIHDAEYAYDHFIAFVEEHIPDLFSRVQSERLRQAHVRGMMADYMKYSCKYPGDLQGRNTLREMLVKAREETGLKHCSMPVRLGYYPVLLCPRLCMPLYDSYRAVRKLRQVIQPLSIFGRRDL